MAHNANTILATPGHSAAIALLFHLGWAQHPHLSSRVEEFIAQCWKERLGQAVEISTT